MKTLVPLILVSLLSACGVTNTTFNRPYLPPEEPLVMPQPSERLTVGKVLAVERADRLRVQMADWPEVADQTLTLQVTGATFPQFPGQCADEAGAAAVALKRVETLLADAHTIELSELQEQADGFTARVWLDNQALDQRLLQEQLVQQGTADWCP
ncbi:hypothetical protein KUV56_13650 [Ferrimonas balearica]|uniref:hypothetical protein n=1 Tax=Ferrimonas balearica TaxID=44012 RepID=UPI001C592C0D|nr:hypothetical protein [Ferrimonas balearica]MBW3140540.1 hypothetical protein [Ferrimonas balearica]